MTVLLDLAMPVMDGRSTARLWREIEAELALVQAARIVIVSASHLSVRPAGVDAMLQKPLTMDQLQRQLLSVGSVPTSGR